MSTEQGNESDTEGSGELVVGSTLQTPEDEFAISDVDTQAETPPVEAAQVEQRFPAIETIPSVDFGEFESAPGTETGSTDTTESRVDPFATATMATTPVIKGPRVGGKGIDGVFWTGGSETDPKAKLEEPASTLAYRPTELKAASILEAKITAGLPEKSQLTVAEASKETKTITLISWIAAVRSEIIDRGMDTVFRIVTPGFSENDILSNWGTVDQEEVSEWVASLLKQDGCKFDKYNLIRSGKFLKSSVSHELWERVRTSVPDHQPSGPEVFTAIILSHQVTSATVVRSLVDELCALRISKIPGENVEVLSQLVIEKAQRIAGSGQEPRDFNMLVATCFLRSQCLEFNILANEFHSKSQFHKKSVASGGINDWKTEIVHPLLQKYTSLKAQGLWPTSSPSTEIQGLKAKIEALEATVADNAESNQYQSSSSNQSGKREPTCWKCGEKGHTKPNCPKADGNKSSQDKSSPRAPPKDGDSHTRTREGTVEKWCRRCRRWTRGDKAHLTDEHVSKKEGEKQVTKASVALTEDDRSYEDESYLMRTRLYKAAFDRDTPDELSWCEECDGFKPKSHTCQTYCYPKGCAGQF
jgi:hypothetical protein